MGAYKSLQTLSYVRPDGGSDKKQVSSNYLLSFEFYSDLILYLTNRNDCPAKGGRAFQRAHWRRSSKKSETSEYEYNGARDSRLEDFSGLSEFEVHMMIFNDENLGDNLLNRYSSMNESLAESDDEFLELNEDNESNSKIDSYLDEMIELIIRDFVIVYLEDMLWEKDKFSTMIK